METGTFAPGANAPLSIIFSKVFKTLLITCICFLIVSMVSKKRK